MIRRFTLQRDEDVSGVSGTGVVAEGVEYSDGTAVIRWITDLKSTAIYDSISTIMKIHGHNGRTYIQFVDEDPDARPENTLDQEVVGQMDDGTLITRGHDADA